MFVFGPNIFGSYLQCK